MDVEAVLDDGTQLNREGVVVQRGAAGDVGLQHRGLRPRVVADGNRAQPQRCHQFVQMRQRGVDIRHGVAHGDDVLLCLATQAAVFGIRH